MSISTIQEKLLNKGGCSTVIFVGIAVIFGVSIFSQCNSAARMNSTSATREGTVVATVGSIPVTSELIQAQISAMPTTDVQSQASMAARATGSTIQRAALHELLAKGPTVTDAEVTKAAAAAADRQIDTVKNQLVQQKQLKPDATDADFEKIVKQQSGKTLAQIRDSIAGEYTTRYKDAAQKAGVLEQLGGQIFVARVGDKMYPNDAALRDSFKNYVVRRIFFNAQSGAQEGPEVRAAKALADLKAGTSFDKLMDTVSNDPPAGGKRSPHQVTDNVPADLFASRPYLAELKDKPINATTGIVEVPGGKAIYQLVAVQNNVPPDFDKNVARYRNSKAEAEVENQVKALVASGAVKWQSPGYSALAAVADASGGMMMMDPAKAHVAFVAGQAALKSDDQAEQTRGALAMLASTAPPPYEGMPPTALPADRKAALEAMTKVGLADGALSLELAKIYAGEKDGAKAVEALLAASRANTRYDAAGLKTFGDIAAEALKLQSAKAITADQLKSIQVQQAQWSAARTEDEKANAAAQKANEEEIKRQQAEAAKTKPAPKPAGGTIAVPSGSTQPAPTMGGSLPKTATGAGR